MLILKPLKYIFLNLEQKINFLTFFGQTNQYYFFVCENHDQSKPAEQLLTL